MTVGHEGGAQRVMVYRKRRGEKTMKKMVVMLMSMIMVFSLTACGGSKPADGGNDSGNNGSVKPAAATAAADAGAADTAATAQNTQSEAEAEPMILGKLSYLGDEKIINSLYLYGNQAGTEEMNEIDRRTENIRSIFELSEWVELYPDSDKTSGITLWVIEHKDDQSFYNDAKLSEETPGFAAYCELNKSEDDPEYNWGSFYLQPDEYKAGYYDFVFTYKGKAFAKMMTRFYNEGELANKTNQELQNMMDAENASLGK